jgi:hypothetical protein
MTGSRRAFALPIVILLALVAALAGTLLLELQSNSSLAVNRQARVYEDHHLAAGMRELIDQWILTGGGDIADRLEDDGLAFELELPQNKRVRVYLEDAQGTVLRDTSSVGGAPARLLDRIIDQLELVAVPPPLPVYNADGTIAGPVEQPPPLFRNVGPIQVSVNSATEQVLDAVASAMSNPDAARTLMRQIRSEARPGSRITPEDLNSMITSLRNLSTTDAQEFRSVLTAQPMLWRLTVETRHGSLSTAPTERSAALIQLPVAGQTLGPTGVIVLSWEDAAPQATAENR